MILSALAAKVFAIEEVHKYTKCVNYLKNAFEIDNLRVESRSLYSLDDPLFYDKFDSVIYWGVLYHVTDPILSLRIIFNCLKDGGICLLETMAVNLKGSYCEYQGAQATLNKPKSEKPRSGWNWFVPSLEALRRMMRDTGFVVKNASLHRDGRAISIGVRNYHVDMLRAGLSKSYIR